LLSQPACPFRLSLRTVFHPTPDALRRSPRSRGPPRAGQPIVGYRGTGQVGPFGRDDSRVLRLGDKAAEWAERIGNCWKKALRQSSPRCLGCALRSRRVLCVKIGRQVRVVVEMRQNPHSLMRCFLKFTRRRRAIRVLFPPVLPSLLPWPRLAPPTESSPPPPKPRLTV
jgi:hypothetical protein